MNFLTYFGVLLVLASIIHFLFLAAYFFCYVETISLRIEATCDLKAMNGKSDGVMFCLHKTKSIIVCMHDDHFTKQNYVPHHP